MSITIFRIFIKLLNVVNINVEVIILLVNLKKLRAEHRVTQKQLADVISVSQQSINKYENHNIEPDIDTLIKIADYFNTSVDYLIGHTDIQRKIESVTSHDLNAEESSLIDSYRKLSPKQRSSIRDVMENYLEL